MKAQCLTEMGQMIGLEPRTVFMEWQPSSKESSGNRMGIRGTYLLQGDPSGRLTPAERATEFLFMEEFNMYIAFFS